jgi:hypothetical protein
MPAFVELFAVELAVAVSAGAVLAFVSGLVSTHRRRELPRGPQGCRNCGSVGTIDAGPDQGRASKRHPE